MVSRGMMGIEEYVSIQNVPIIGMAIKFEFRGFRVCMYAKLNLIRNCILYMYKSEKAPFGDCGAFLRLWRSSAPSGALRRLWRLSATLALLGDSGALRRRWRLSAPFFSYLLFQTLINKSNESTVG